MDLIQEVNKHVRSSSHRMTPQRRLILDHLQSLDSHPTAEELLKHVQEHDPTIHLSTIYRTLRWLEAEGWIQARIFNDDRRVERFDAISPGEHYHFVCNECKKVIEFNNLLVNAIKAQFELHSGAKVDFGSVVLYGVCAECRDQASFQTNPIIPITPGE